MNKKTIIADASPLIAFGRINQIALLSKVVGEIIVPEVVADECLVDSSRSGAQEIKKAIKEKIITIFPNAKIKEHKQLLEILDEGEAAAITLAMQSQNGLLIDERAGREVAKKLKIKVIGTAGVLLLAKQKKLIYKVSPFIQKLHQSGYRFSHELIQEIMKHAKER